MAYKFVNADQLDADMTTVADAIRTKGGTSGQLAFPTGMASAISAISTGVELNFDVVGNPQPSTAKENTIWVDTDKINNYYFSATQPENMVDYDVWIIAGAYSTVEFNALKKNGIQVYPISAKQYVSGAWVNKTAKSYQGGAWVDWWDGSSLYDKGNEFEAITGGWVVTDVICSASYTFGEPIITKTDSSITIQNNSSGDKSAYIGNKNAISLNGCTTVHAIITATASAGRQEMVVVPEGETIAHNGHPVTSAITATGQVDLDISGIDFSKTYHILLGTTTNYNGSERGLIAFSKVWLT